MYAGLFLLFDDFFRGASRGYSVDRYKIWWVEYYIQLVIRMNEELFSTITCCCLVLLWLFHCSFLKGQFSLFASWLFKPSSWTWLVNIWEACTLFPQNDRHSFLVVQAVIVFFLFLFFWSWWGKLALKKFNIHNHVGYMVGRVL